jgi:glycosyltransferase involved in cell wall biosynthesis
MSTNHKLLIINRIQFGYHIGTYQYCKQAADKINIVNCSFDAGRPKINIPGVQCIYVSRRGNILVRYFRLMRNFLAECKKDYDVVFIQYFLGCSLLKLVYPRKPFIMDIRTGNVSQNKYKRLWLDLILRIESLFFQYISVISESLSEKFKLPKKKIHILPIGAEPVNLSVKKFNSLHLLYVGTFNGRQIDDTIRGFARFYHEYKDSIKITYEIIGDGFNNELKQFRKLVDDLGIGDSVSLPGYIHQSQLFNYYNRCNIGVSYIPINNIYDCQPPTKTFEYLLAGMPVIATETSENRRVINDTNGVLIQDNPNSFYEAIKAIYCNRYNYNSQTIFKTNQKYSWKNIVETNFLPYMKNLIVNDQLTTK